MHHTSGSEIRQQQMALMITDQSHSAGTIESPNQEKSRVLMIVENVPYPKDPRVRNEAKALQEAGYRVSVISPAWARGLWPKLVDGVKVYAFPIVSAGDARMGYLLEYTIAMLAIAILTALVFFTDGFDVIQMANPPDCIILFVAIYKLFGKLIVYDQHDLCPELYKARFDKPDNTVESVLSRLEKISYRMADHVIVTNESYKRIAVERGGLSPSKITVVRNGPQMKTLRTAEIDPVLRSKSRNIILYAGIVGAQDGLDYLCGALHSLRYELGREDFYCVVLGDGDALQSVKSMAHDLGLDGLIWFAGWVSDPALYARYLATADICVAPEPSNSYNDRSTFIKVLEYMGAKKPTVAFDLPETRYSAGPAALYARPNDKSDLADKIAKLMDEPALRDSAGEIGQKRIQTRLAWEYSVPNLLKVYDELVNPHQPPSSAAIATTGPQESGVDHVERVSVAIPQPSRTQVEREDKTVG